MTLRRAIWRSVIAAVSGHNAVSHKRRGTSSLNSSSVVSGNRAVCHPGSGLAALTINCHSRVVATHRAVNNLQRELVKDGAAEVVNHVGIISITADRAEADGQRRYIV